MVFNHYSLKQICKRNPLRFGGQFALIIDSLLRLVEQAKSKRGPSKLGPNILESEGVAFEDLPGPVNHPITMRQFALNTVRVCIFIKTE